MVILFLHNVGLDAQEMGIVVSRPSLTPAFDCLQWLEPGRPGNKTSVPFISHQERTRTGD